jgi:hypothetical protein
LLGLGYRRGYGDGLCITWHRPDEPGGAGQHDHLPRRVVLWDSGVDLLAEFDRLYGPAAATTTPTTPTTPTKKKKCKKPKKHRSAVAAKKKCKKKHHR